MKPALRAALVAMPLFLGGCANNPDPYRVEGDAAMQTFRYDDAARAYAQYLEISPGQPEIRAKYGRALLAAGRPLDAAEQFRIAVAQAPNNDQYLDELCESLLRADKRDDLFALLRTNCSQRGRVSDHIRLGRFSQRMGDGDTARTALISAARIDAGRTAAPQIALYDFYASIGDAPKPCAGSAWPTTSSPSPPMSPSASPLPGRFPARRSACPRAMSPSNPRSRRAQTTQTSPNTAPAT